MPSDVVDDENGGGFLNWDENLLLRSNQDQGSWFTTTSASTSAPAPAAHSDQNFSQNSNFQSQSLFHDTSGGDLSTPVANTHPSDNVFFNSSHQLFELDTYEGQHWSDLPSQDNENPPTGDVSISGAEEKTTQVGLVESPLDSFGPVGEVLSQSSVGKARKQDFAISHALLSPSRSMGLSKSQRENRQAREGLPPNHKSNKPSMSAASSYNSPNSGQGHVDRRKAPNPYTRPKSSSLNRMFSRTAVEAQDDEDSRRNQLDLHNRGGSVVSSASGHSRSDNTFHKSDTLDDEFNSNTSRRSENRGAGKTPGVLRTHQGDDLQNGQHTLPRAKGFSIQIGSEVFKLSGASIMSDAPSYFSKFFEEQMQHDDGSGSTRTLYIDRDPVTFQDICRHLQGYYLQPRDGSHFVQLYADAQFYSLPRLISQLFESEIFVQIGGQNFQIPRDIFSSPGDSPNFFSLGFAVFFSTSSDVFPGLESGGLLRPPSVHPPCVPNRSAQVFSELLHLLRGYPLRIRDKDHRAELLRDCRYFNLRGLEQKIILHDISYNAERGTSEIIIRLEDIRQSGVSFVGDASPSDRSPLGGWVNYSRPFVDETSYEIIVEIGDESTRIDFRSMRADFYGDAKARIASLFQVVANKMNLPTNAPLGLMMSSGGAAAHSVSPGNTPLSEDRVKIRIERDAHIVLDGEEYLSDGLGLDSQVDFEYAETSSPAPGRIGQPSTPSSAGPGHPGINWPTPTPQSSSSHALNFQYPPRPSSTKPPPRKRKRRGSLDEFGEWMIRKGQWRLRVQPRGEPSSGSSVSGGGGGVLEGCSMEIVLHAVKLDAISGQKGRNTMRGFLT